MKILYVGGGCCHDYENQKTIIKDGLEERFDCEVTVVHDGGSSTNAMIPLFDNANWFDGYDAVVHHECFADVRDPEYINRILAPHRAGLPAVMVHCAVHSYGALRGDTDSAKEWRRFLGVHSNGHGPHYPHEVLNVNGEHPVMQGFGTGWWNPAGELYRSIGFEDTVVPLCTSKDQTSGKDQVCVWANQFDKGRVFGTTLGHHNETVGDAKFLDLIARGVQWAADKPITVEWNKVEAKPERENLALNKPVTASSVQGGNDFAHATDGNTGTRWCASGAEVPQWVQVDLGSPQTLTGVDIVWEFPSQRYRVSIEGSTDGTTFKKLVKGQTDQAAVDFEADNIQHVRVTCSKTSGGWVSIRELKVLGTKVIEPEKSVAGIDPREQALLDKVKVPEGFGKTIFAAPPAVNYPVYVAADVDGTVFVAQDKNGSLDREPNRGSILRLRDLDGDGRADECKRFVDNVDSPRGLVFDRDRVYVMHPPHLSAFIDHDGDGVSDEQQILVKNIAFTFKDRPADHTSNGVTLGIDGWLYLAIGDFGFMEAEGIDGRTLQLRGGGVVRVRPDGTGLHLFSRGTRNILEVAVSPRLEAFARDNTNDGGGWDVRLHHFTGGEDHGYPRRYKNFSDEIVSPLADYGGGSGCGAGWIDEANWPAEWNDSLYTADWGRGVIFQHPIQPSGATFSAEQRDFVSVPRATDIDVDAQGNAYVSSWDGGSFTYKDENVGFVARVTPKGATPEKPVVLREASEEQLIAYLLSDSHRLRLAAQRELLVRDWSDATRAKLEAFAGGTEGPLEGRIAALFTLALAPDGSVPKAAFTVTDIRPWAMMAASEMKAKPIDGFVPSTSSSPAEQIANARQLILYGGSAPGISGLMQDAWARALSQSDPLLRHTWRNALIAVDGWEVAAQILKKSDDATARLEASRVMAEIHSADCVSALMSIVESSSTNREAKHLAFAALARLVHTEGEWTGQSWGTRPDNAGPYYSFARWEQSDRIEDALRKAIGNASNDELSTLLSAVSANQVRLDDTLRTVIAAAQTDKAVWPAAAAQLAKADNLPDGSVELLNRIANDADTPLAALASSAEALLGATDPAAFAGAAKALARLGGEINQPTGRDAIAKFRNTNTLERHVDGIIASTAADGDVGKWAIHALLLLRKDAGATKETKAKVESRFTDLASTDEGRSKLLTTIESIRGNDFNPIIVELASASGASGDRARDLAKNRKLKVGPILSGPPIKGMPIADVMAKVAKPTNNMTAGQGIFTKLSCSKCHSVSPSEPSRGPELSNAARVYKRNQLAEAILDPNKTIAQGFATNLFIMADGRVLTGFVVKEADAEVTMRDAEGKEHILKTEDIDDRVVQKQSIMPAGQVDTLSIAELSALLDYLDALGE